MKIIVIKKPDDGVIVIIPNSKKYGDSFGQLPLEKCKAIRHHIERGLEWFICDHVELPSKKTHESRKQWYHDGNTVKVDHNWEKRLMPPHCIKSRHLGKTNLKLEAEISKGKPDTIVISGLILEKEKCQSMTELDWYGKALENLNQRVSVGETDKPIIRQKLMEKLNGGTKL